MDPKEQSSPPDSEDSKATFRKPSNDVASRKYRRRSPDIKSSGDPESPRNDRSSSPISTRGEPAKVSEHRESRKDDRRKYDRDQRGKAGDADSHCKISHPYSRHDDYSRREKYVDEDRRNQTSYFERDSRGTSRSDRTREESDNSRSRDYRRYSDKYSRDRDTQRIKDKESYPVSDRKQTNSTSEDKDWDRHRGVRGNRDGQRGYGRSSEYRSERTDYRDESRGRVKESLFSRRDDDKYHTREFQKGNPREFDDQREKQKRDDSETDKDKDTYSRETSGGQNEDKSVCVTESQQSEAKRTKLFSSDKAVHSSGDGEKQSSSPKQVPAAGNVAVGNVSDATNDLNAAKVAAMKAAELVNKNLVGGSFMSTEQKKKLLWGSKKSTTTSEEPSVHRWDTSLFGDRERQEKFNKLMGVKGDVKAETQTNKNNNQEGLQAEKQEELQMELERQYTAGLRRRDGRTVGLGL